MMHVGSQWLQWWQKENIDDTWVILKMEIIHSGYGCETCDEVKKERTTPVLTSSKCLPISSFLSPFWSPAAWNFKRESPSSSLGRLCSSLLLAGFELNRAYSNIHTNINNMKKRSARRVRILKMFMMKSSCLQDYSSSFQC